MSLGIVLVMWVLALVSFFLPPEFALGILIGMVAVETWGVYRLWRRHK